MHRDLKPANIMLMAQGRDHVKVLDFGLAKSVATDTAVTTMTNAGALLGTPAFMPPELALGQPCDGRADLYALGVILYLIGSGRLPFMSESAHELVALHGHEPAPPMTGVPPALAAVIDRLLLKDPAHRFQSAAETREALEAAMEAGRMTPSPFASDTSPSLGPFPAGAQAFRNLRDTPLPYRLSGAELDKLASSDTLAVGAMATIADNAPRRRWVAPILIAFAIVGAGLGALVATRSDDEATPATVQDVAPTPTPETRPAVAPPAGSDAVIEHTTVPAKATQTKVETKPVVAKTQIKTKAIVKTQTKTQPATTKTTPTPPGKGSAQMPF